VSSKESAKKLADLPLLFWLIGDNQNFLNKKNNLQKKGESGIPSLADQM
jgi:hypothetical protein